MKKILFAISAVALLFATSCKKESVNPAVDVPEGSFLATIDNGANPQNAPVVKDGMGTMTTIDANRYVIWENNDQIAINGVSYTTDATGNAVVFAPTEPQQPATGQTYQAFYPASLVTEDGNKLPATQIIELDNNNNITVRNLPMYATSTTNQLTFHNICAAFKITIPSFVNGATRIEISSDQQMNGSFVVQGDSAFMNKQTLDDADKKVTIEKTSGTFAENEVVYIAVPANTYSNLKVEFFNGTSSMWTKTLPSCTLRVNRVYNVSVTPSYIPVDGFCFTALSTNTDDVTIRLNKEEDESEQSGHPVPSYTMQYFKTGSSNWTSYTITDGVGEGISLAPGEKVYFRNSTSGSGEHSISSTFWHYSYFSTTGDGYVDVSGNIMYLLNGTNPPTSFASSKVFPHLFKGMTSLKSAKNLILPAATMTQECYEGMFYGCTSLTTAPTLPATTMAKECYQYMFDGCTSLTTAPALNATTLAEQCYASMFFSCKSLTTAPELPATTLQKSCYELMFGNCTSLTTAPELNATTLAKECYFSMFNGCTSLTTAPDLPATTLAESCYTGMFNGCTSLTTVPELHATTLADQCYRSMFRYCTSLTQVTMLATDVSAWNCLCYWLYDAGKDATTPTVTINSSLSNTKGTAGATITEETPTHWTITNGTNSWNGTY